MSEFANTTLNKVRRLPDRASYNPETIYSIIDGTLICHVAFVENGQPFVIPVIHARMEDRIVFHGAKTSRLLRKIASGDPVCAAFTLLDGLVLAKSVFHHSMNYRAAVVFGSGVLLEDKAEKLAALRAITEHIAQGRWEEARQPNRKELGATSVAALAITSASAKVRSGPPSDDPADVDLPVWAGILPLELTPLAPLPASEREAALPLPYSIRKTPPAAK